MRSEFLDAGQIVNTHGIRGEVKVLPWCDSPEYLTGFQRVLISGSEFTVERARVQGTCVLMKLRGVDDVNEAMKLREKTVQIFRADAPLEEGRNFISDLIGLPVLADGVQIGELTDVIQLPSNDVYEVKGEGTYLIPVVDDFVQEVNAEAGYINVKLIEGMRCDE